MEFGPELLPLLGESMYKKKSAQDPSPNGCTTSTIHNMQSFDPLPNSPPTKVAGGGGVKVEKIIEGSFCFPK